MESKAVVFEAPGRVCFDEIAILDPGPGYALVEIEHSSISIGTERWCLIGEIQVGGGRLIEFPCVPGYQAAGIAREVGPGVRDVSPGDRVFSSCGRLAQEGLLSRWAPIGLPRLKFKNFLQICDCFINRFFSISYRSHPGHFQGTSAPKEI